MAEEASPADPRAGGATFRTIGELAELCGQYCWVERRIFEVTGSRASDPGPGDQVAGDVAGGDAEIRVVLSQMAARHGFFATQWRDRLPVRKGVDAEALVLSPPGPSAEALDLIEGEPGLMLVFGALALQFMPRLLESYRRSLAQASPVSEAPVRAVLEGAVLSAAAEIRHAGIVLERLSPARQGVESGGEFGSRIQRVLEGGADTFPGARAS